MSGFPVGVTLERLNAAILDEGERARFLTLVCGVVEPVRRGQVRVGLVVAGHPPPFLVPAPRCVRSAGLRRCSGSRSGWPHRGGGLLERGDLLVTVTDGVLEGRDDARMLGETSFERDLAQVADLSAQMAAEHVRRLVLDFVSGPHHDDMAVLALRAPAGGALTLGIAGSYALRSVSGRPRPVDVPLPGETDQDRFRP